MTTPAEDAARVEGIARNAAAKITHGEDFNRVIRIITPALLAAREAGRAEERAAAVADIKVVAARMDDPSVCNFIIGRIECGVHLAKGE